MSNQEHTIVENALAALQSITPNIAEVMAKVNGYRVLIWHPFGTNSAHGKYSNAIRYTESPQVKTYLLGGNLFQNAMMGTFDGVEFGTFLSEEPYLLSFGFRIPENSKVCIKYKESSRWMKVRKHTALDGESSYVAVFNVLSPLTSDGIQINDEPEPAEDSILILDPRNARGIAGQNLI